MPSSVARVRDVKCSAMRIEDRRERCRCRGLSSKRCFDKLEGETGLEMPFDVA